MEGGAKIVGVFRVKNHDFTPKNLIFSNFRGGRVLGASPLDPPPYSEYVEMVKLTLSITLGYIFLWNVIRRIYLPCLQFISKNTFDEPWRRHPHFFLTSKVEEWLMMTFVLENCLLDLFVVLDLDLGSILIDNSFFFCLSKVGNKYYLFLTTVWKMSFSVRV